MFGISGVSIYIIYVPIGSMYLLFTYMRWKMATFKGTWLGKYSLHGSYNYLYIYHIIFSTTEAYTFSRPKSALVKVGPTPQTPPTPRRNSRCREAIVFLGEGGGGGWGKTRGKQWDNPPPSSGTSTVSHQDLALCIWQMPLGPNMSPFQGGWEDLFHRWDMIVPWRLPSGQNRWHRYPKSRVRGCM